MNSVRLNKRIYAVVIVLSLLAICIALYFAQIMIVPEDTQTVALLDIDTERGPILDRNGRLLAIQTELPTVTVWTPHVIDAEGTAESLSQILNVPYEDILEDVQTVGRDIIIKRNIPPSESEVIELLKQQGELQGVNLRPGPARIYPEGRSTSHVIGFVGTDNVGLEGIELTLNDLLSPLDTLALADRTTFGSQIFLTIDIVIQHIAEEIADRLMAEHDPDSVMILTADARSGEILSYVSKPDFNPNSFADFDLDSRRNRPIQMTYEPGSAFKVFSLASIMQLGGIQDASVFNTSSGYTNARITNPITDLGNYGSIGPEGIIKFSSNVGAAYASDSVSQEDFYTMLNLFGFGQRTNIELNGEERGILAPPGRWSGRSKPTIAIGQEIAVTAMQMVQATTVIANEGIMLRPQIIKRIVNASGDLIQEFQREEIRRVLRSNVAEQMLGYMQSASTDGGTGRRAFLETVPISVKTGTGEVYDPRIRSYSDELFLASTLAIFPSDDPEIIIYLVIQHPRGESFLGGVIAAPAVRELANFLINYLQIDAQSALNGLPGNVQVLEPVLPDINESIPDYSALPLSTVLPLYGRRDLSVQIYGSGWVQRQSPPPGTPFSEGMLIELFLDTGAGTGNE